jgi:transcriptional regulator with GAF, ATPase, and Fis domain
MKNVGNSNDQITDHLENPSAFAEIITQNPKMLDIFQYMEAIASTHQPVLIMGETGVGKELFAKAIHTLSGLQGKLVPVNVSALDDTVFSDILFGHKKGAFTGADKVRQGLIELATKGTLFLDEIGDLSLMSQIKLLRLLQDGDYLPLGSDEQKYTDARFVIATNKALWALQKTGQFREDLIYRLNSHQIKIPPLRERFGDIPILVRYFVNQIAETQQLQP